MTTSDALDDDEFPAILAGARRGEGRSVERLFVDLQPRLLRYLRGTEPRLADDVAGEVWLAVARGIGSFEGDLPGFRAWVFTIARRRLADQRRSAVRRRTEPAPVDVLADVPGDADPVDAALGRLSAADAAAFVTAHLPADQADVVLLRVLGDLDVAHVAEVMGHTPNWVRVMQHRALRRLASVLGPEEIPARPVMRTVPPAICPS